MKIETIKENRDFQRAYKKGKSYVSPVVVTYIVKNKENNLQIGITTARKIGKAVQRNRARRIIRAAASAIIPELKSGYNIVFVARTRTVHAKSYDIEKALRAQFKKAGMFRQR